MLVYSVYRTNHIVCTHNAETWLLWLHSGGQTIYEVEFDLLIQFYEMLFQLLMTTHTKIVWDWKFQKNWSKIKKSAAKWAHRPFCVLPLLKLYLRFQINSNGFSRDRSFGHNFSLAPLCLVYWSLCEVTAA